MMRKVKKDVEYKKTREKQLIKPITNNNKQL